MNREAITTLVQAAGFDAQTASETVQDTLLSAVMMELSQEQEWSWLRAENDSLNLTVGSADLSVAAVTDLAYPIELRIRRDSLSLGYETLDRVDASAIKRELNLAPSTARGVPRWWTWADGGIIVWPAPDQAYDVELDYIKDVESTALDDDAEVAAQFDRRFDTLLAWGCVRWLAVRKRDAALYQVANAEWEAGKRRMVRADRRPTPDHVKDWAGWGNLSAQVTEGGAI